MIYVCYFSLTGNTQKVAKRIAEEVGGRLYNIAEDNYSLDDASCVFLGFLNYMGKMNKEVIEFTKKIPNIPIYLFITMGSLNPLNISRLKENIAKDFSGGKRYSDDIYISQGRLTPNVIQRYEKMKKEGKDMDEDIQNYYESLKHPDESDLENAAKWSKNITNM